METEIVQNYKIPKWQIVTTDNHQRLNDVELDQIRAGESIEGLVLAFNSMLESFKKLQNRLDDLEGKYDQVLAGVMAFGIRLGPEPEEHEYFDEL
jgi:hypothetical protein